MSGSSDDIDEIRAAKRSLAEDFIWFRRADKAYVIVDPAIVARAQAAWRDSDKLGASMEALGQQMETHGDKMEALGEKMEAVGRAADKAPPCRPRRSAWKPLASSKPHSARSRRRWRHRWPLAMKRSNGQLEQQMDALSGQQDALAHQMDQQAEVMDAESDRMEAQMKPMEALSRQMEEASKPMDALGKQMDALGKQQEKLVDQAERETQKLISEAMAQGLVRPAPSSTTR